MSEPPSECRAYLDRYKEMSFRELREFIDESLAGLSDASSDDDRPRSKAEFDALFGMLCAHLDAQTAEAPEPAGPRPIDDVSYVPYVFSWFEPSEELDYLYERQDHLSDLLDEARGDQSRRRYAEHLESELKVVEREIAEREFSEKHKHEKRRHKYEKADEKYRRGLRRRKEKARREQKWRRKVAQRERIEDRVRGAIERAFKPDADAATEHVRWRLLPRGALSEEWTRGYYAGLQDKNPGTRYDPDRIVKPLSLGPNRRYEEVGGTEGYTVFTFPRTSSVLLECPIVEHALYVIHKDRERWSMMSKQELIADESGEIVRIIHRPGWLKNVQEDLGI